MKADYGWVLWVEFRGEWWPVYQSNKPWKLHNYASCRLKLAPWKVRSKADGPPDKNHCRSEAPGGGVVPAL